MLYLCFGEEVSLWFTLRYYNIQQGIRTFLHFFHSFFQPSSCWPLSLLQWFCLTAHIITQHCFPHLRSDSSMQSSLKPAEWLSRDHSGKLVRLGRGGVRMKRNLDWSRDTCNAWQPFLGPSDLADFWLILWEHYKLWIVFAWVLYKIFPGCVGEDWLLSTQAVSWVSQLIAGPPVHTAKCSLLFGQFHYSIRCRRWDVVFKVSTISSKRSSLCS